MYKASIVGSLVVSVATVLSTACFGWSTGIGIIDNNVPSAAKDPGTVLKDPVGALTDLAGKGIPGLDKAIEKALPQEKKNIANAVLTTGFVTRPLGPIGDLVTFSVLVQPRPNTSAEARNVPVRAEPPKPKPNKYVVTVDCIVQRSDKSLEAYSIKLPAGLPNDFKGLKAGDIFTFKASGVCPTVGGEKSLPTVVSTFRGIGIDPLAVEGKEFKYFFTATPAA
jgi:hypothetical protein